MRAVIVDKRRGICSKRPSRHSFSYLGGTREACSSIGAVSIAQERPIAFHEPGSDRFLLLNVKLASARRNAGAFCLRSCTNRTNTTRRSPRDIEKGVGGLFSL
jgi:hypothetical protein